MKFHACALALAVVSVAGCGSAPQPGTALPAPGTPAVSPCAAVESQMSPRQKLAQLLVVGVDAADPGGAAALVRDQQVGGIFVGGDATELLRDGALDRVRQAAHWQVSVAVDEEGGRVQRIDELDGPIPSARKMAATMTPGQVHDLARQRGEQLRARGVTVDFAPSLDVSAQPDHGPIGDRSFSADPAVARAYGLAFATGLRDAGIEPVLKHFPGHGEAQGDSHEGRVTTAPLDQLRTRDLRPYESIGEFGPVSVMVGHLSVPGLTGATPASIAPEAYRLLRGDYRFTGPVITDDLGAMRAITSSYPLPDAVLRALLAGADQALWSSGGDVTPVLDRLEKALADGELPQSRVTDALSRVLPAKQSC
ncbi:glycoside hydrolase family 3 protein [Amycolatopsis sp. K13G38]|uniref:beta-N-acetylhexosaminidase n=1 Tax=Amycolatopsis acididurans TaxID=2724524 RepID=A0ABX1IX21_9PSEU|nr:glycoside hydrolase family 3 N-terminal domain-containing protein [Amycolatopsis acididurans]NKQ52041.1 glycoside hydrolase family 3 protein [Amycolatopsis acididurans]